MKIISSILLVMLGTLPMEKTEKIIQLGETQIKLIEYPGKHLLNVLFLNVHEDEQTSIQAIQKIRERKPVNFSFLSHQQTRNIVFKLNDGETAEFDPNRIYTKKGRKASLEKFGNSENHAVKTTKILFKQIKKLIGKYDVIVTLHNNTDENYHILSYADGGDESKNTLALHVSNEWDEDDFIYTTEKSYFEYFQNKNINVILQDNNGCENDGSLSVYCGKKRIPYINIEAEKGHLNQQISLIEATLKLLENSISN